MGLTNDITILGAGIAGCASAIALKKQCPSWRISLLDIKPPQALFPTSGKISEKPVIGETLPAQVVVPLQRLGLWDVFLAMNHAPSTGTLSIWGANRAHANESIFSPFGNAWHINRRQFNQAILREALSLGVELLAGSQLVSINDSFPDPDQGSGRPLWMLGLKTSKTGGRTAVSRQFRQVSSRFIVDASGRSAGACKMLGVDKMRHDTLMGVYRYYSPNPDKTADIDTVTNPGPSAENAADTATLIESVPQGWWYSAALPSGHRVVSLMADADSIKRRKLRQYKNFDRAMGNTRIIYPSCKNLEPVCDPAVTAACTQNLSRISGPGWLAVGDAAFTFDPLSSLGIFKALRMSGPAAYAVQDYFNGKDRELKKYRWLGRAEFEAYLEKRKDYYSREKRFADHDFWRRRRAA